MEYHLHPLIIHFPIALFVSAFIFEILSLVLKKELFHKTALCNYIFGVLGACAAVAAALLDGEFLKHIIFYQHRTLGYATAGFGVLSLIILLLAKKKSKKFFRILFFLILLLTTGLVSATGFYGGKLVYEYGIGVAE